MARRGVGVFDGDPGGNGDCEVRPASGDPPTAAPGLVGGVRLLYQEQRRIQELRLFEGTWTCPGPPQTDLRGFGRTVAALPAAISGYAWGLPAPFAPSASGLDSRARRLVERARAWVERNVEDEGLSVEALASALHMSRTSLHRKLVSSIGQSPGEFIRGIRLQMANQLLREGAGSVSEIAYSVGFVSLSGFSRAYREQFGESPSSSRRRTNAPIRRRRPAWNTATNN